MRYWSLFFMFALAVCLNGCATVGAPQGPQETVIQRPFFGNTIVYSVDSDAREHMV